MPPDAPGSLCRLSTREWKGHVHLQQSTEQQMGFQSTIPLCTLPGRVWVMVTVRRLISLLCLQRPPRRPLGTQTERKQRVGAGPWPSCGAPVQGRPALQPSLRLAPSSSQGRREGEAGREAESTHPPGPLEQMPLLPSSTGLAWTVETEPGLGPLGPSLCRTINQSHSWSQSPTSFSREGEEERSMEEQMGRGEGRGGEMPTPASLGGVGASGI